MEKKTEKKAITSSFLFFFGLPDRRDPQGKVRQRARGPAAEAARPEDAARPETGLQAAHGHRPRLPEEEPRLLRVRPRQGLPRHQGPRVQSGKLTR